MTKFGQFTFKTMVLTWHIFAFVFGILQFINLSLFLAWFMAIASVIIGIAGFNRNYAKNYALSSGQLPKLLDIIFYILIILIPVLMGYFTIGGLWVFSAYVDRFVREFGEAYAAEDKLKEAQNEVYIPGH